MKTVIQIAVFSVLATGMSLTHAQGTFQNLDFEQANPVIISGSQYNDSTVENALPGWTVVIAGVQQTETSVNDASVGAPWVMLVAPGQASPPGFAPIDGNYSVLLQNYGTFNSPSISQTLTIPTGSESILFKAQPPSAGFEGPLNVQINNQTVAYYQVGTGPNYVLLRANISAWAGQTETLTILDPDGSGNWELDDISFSQTAVVPEPSPLILTSLGGVACAFYRRLSRKSR